MSFSTYDHEKSTEPDYLEPLPDATETAPVDWSAVNGRRPFGSKLPADLLEYAGVYEDEEREKRDAEYIPSEHESHLRNRNGY